MLSLFITLLIVSAINLAMDICFTLLHSTLYGIESVNAISVSLLLQTRSISGHDAMRCDGTHVLCTIIYHKVSSSCNCSSCIHHVINNDDVSVSHISDNLHRSDFVRTQACLIAQQYVKPCTKLNFMLY